MVSNEYRAYLLRLWRVGDDGGRWRARLENVDTGEAQGFASLDKLVEFLQNLEGRADQPGEGTGEKSNEV